MAQVQHEISTFCNISRYGMRGIIFLKIKFSIEKDEKKTPSPSNKKDIWPWGKLPMVNHLCQYAPNWLNSGSQFWNKYRSISYLFRDKHFCAKFQKWFSKFQNFQIFQILVILLIIMHVIPNFRLFRSMSYRFRDKHFLHKNGKIDHFSKFQKIFKFQKFSNFGHLTYYDACDPKCKTRRVF